MSALDRGGLTWCTVVPLQVDPCQQKVFPPLHSEVRAWTGKVSWGNGPLVAVFVSDYASGAGEKVKVSLAPFLYSRKPARLSPGKGG